MIYLTNFWRLFRAKIFARAAETTDQQYPLAAVMRSRRDFHGSVRIIPLAYLEAIALPGDYPLEEPDEAAAQALIEARYVAGDPVAPIAVTLPANGSPTVDRKSLPTLAAARALGLDEIKVRVFWP